MDKPRLGHVGVGVMGGSLARRLLREHAWTVLDLSPERRAEFASLGATVVCDAASFTADDLITTDLVYRGRVGEIASVRHDPRHRWVFFSLRDARRSGADKMSHYGARWTGAAFLLLGVRRPMRPCARASKFAPLPFSKTDRRSVPHGGRWLGQMIRGQ